MIPQFARIPRFTFVLLCILLTAFAGVPSTHAQRTPDQQPQAPAQDPAAQPPQAPPPPTPTNPRITTRNPHHNPLHPTRPKLHRPKLHRPKPKPRRPTSSPAAVRKLRKKSAPFARRNKLIPTTNGPSTSAAAPASP